jgi:hypothetical protein
LKRELEEHEKEIRKVKAEMEKMKHNTLSWVVGGTVLVAAVVMFSRVLMGE